MKKTTSTRKTVGGIIVLILVVALVWIVVKSVRHHQEASTSVSIIISPHINDAVLSLGGMIAVNARPTIIADFFDSSASLPTNAVIQGGNATIPALLNTTVQTYNYQDQTYAGDTATEESDLAKTIQAILVANAGKTIYIYGPATFDAALNNPDTQLLHQAFLDVATGYPASNVQFFIYENYPAIATFNQTIVYSLKKNLENESDQNGSAISFVEVDIPLSASQVNKKAAELTALGEDSTTIAAGQQFTDSRCGIDPNQACEAVYQIIQATSSAPTLY